MNKYLTLVPTNGSKDSIKKSRYVEQNRIRPH